MFPPPTHLTPAGRHSDARNVPRVPSQQPDAVAGLHVPNAYRLVHAPGHHVVSVRMKPDARARTHTTADTNQAAQVDKPDFCLYVAQTTTFIYPVLVRSSHGMRPPLCYLGEHRRRQRATWSATVAAHRSTPASTPAENHHQTPSSKQ